MEPTRSLPDPKAQAEDVKDDPTLARVLLSQVLIEEYEALDQPPIPEFENLKHERRYDKQTIKKIYKLINDAQHRHIAELRAKFSKQFTRNESLVNNAILYEASAGDDLREVLGQEFDNNKQQNGPIAEDKQAYIERRLIETYNASTGNNIPPKIDLAAAQTLRSALCLSGGGIRSATFNLGILQGLARHGLLDRFDYLSTVSGGGFIGGWVSAWKYRSGLKQVVNELRKPAEPLVPDPKPVEHLRIYSNYLSPQPGLLSADTWTLIATLIRNLLLNWFVFIPVLLAFLLVPRMWASIVLRSGSNPLEAVGWSWWIGVLAAIVALSYIGLNLPSSNSYTATSSKERFKIRQRPFLIGCLLWLVISAASFSVYLWNWHVLGFDPMLWRSYARLGIAIVAFPWLLCVFKVLWTTEKKLKRKRVFPIIAATFLIFLVQLIVGYIASAVVSLLLPKFYDQGLLYSVFSVPLVLLLMGFEAVLITGFTSRLANDDDQEWWARAGAWVLIVAVMWILVHLLVLYGPLLILNLETTIGKLLGQGRLRNLDWSDWGKMAATVLGFLSGVITLFGGFSAKTPANDKEAQKAGTGGLLLAVLTQVLAPIFLAFVIILLSLGTDWLLISRPSQYFNTVVVGMTLPPASSPLAKWHCLLITYTPFRLLVFLFFMLLLLGVVLGRLISTNVFSLQYLWRNRIIRAYLGASHTDRRPNPFTNFDKYDNVHMHQLWPQPVTSRTEDTDVDPTQPKVPFTRKLFHVLNLALNLTGGEKLQWQDRKAESFTVSPLHAGSYWLGYRRSSHYGGTDGITLGGSVAVSGAFVSPNMGFMMSSPVVRFLMALFNVRFGWWLGNPGPAGDRTNIFERILTGPLKLLGFEVKRPFRLDSPRLSVIPFLSEATGSIDDKSSYVYLSDGGHFENLGLYEMVLRRVRFIVVCDATTDPDYSFESLAMSIRQIRVDLGVPIELQEMAVGVPSQNLKKKYCAIGTIRYSCVDRDPDDTTTTDDDFDGTLIFIKPSLIGEEPRDVINYWQSRGTFPQEVITDQWFSEAQFESYRALGSRIIDAICGDGRNQINLAAFAEKVRDHNAMNFRAFDDEIGFMALQEVFRDGVAKAPLQSYRGKVQKFMEDLLR